jgi:transglutaminase-like putative cysteine protease
MPRTYRVTHRTEYTYESEVSASYGQLHLLPRDLSRQRCRGAQVRVDPFPETLRERVDYFGNRVSFFAIHEPHVALTVTASSIVEVDEGPDGLSLLGQRPWEEAREALRRGELPEYPLLAEYLLDSPLVAASDTYRAYAAEVFAPGRPLLDAVGMLSATIHSDFAYKPGSTSVTTPLAEAFEQREGVCQDFAHLGIACLRSLGLPARYVSGYLETEPAPGTPKLTGIDGSHAWFSVFVPEVGWVDVDPTNDQFVGARHVVTAYGRDYGDVPPLSGVIYTEGKTEALRVAVDVVPLSG